MLFGFSSLNNHRLIKVILINNRSIQISCEEKVFPQFQESENPFEVNVLVCEKKKRFTLLEKFDQREKSAIFKVSS